MIDKNFEFAILFSGMFLLIPAKLKLMHRLTVQSEKGGITNVRFDLTKTRH